MPAERPAYGRENAGNIRSDAQLLTSRVRLPARPIAGEPSGMVYRRNPRAPYGVSGRTGQTRLYMGA
jgi:hypothetical protein